MHRTPVMQNPTRGARDPPQGLGLQRVSRQHPFGPERERDLSKAPQQAPSTRLLRSLLPTCLVLPLVYRVLTLNESFSPPPPPREHRGPDKDDGGDSQTESKETTQNERRQEAEDLTRLECVYKREDRREGEERRERRVSETWQGSFFLNPARSGCVEHLFITNKDQSNDGSSNGAHHRSPLLRNGTY